MNWNQSGLVLNPDFALGRLLLLAGPESDLACGGGVGGGDSRGQRGHRVHGGGHVRRDQAVRSGRGGLQVRHRRVPGTQVHVLRRPGALKQEVRSDWTPSEFKSLRRDKLHRLDQSK